MNTPNQREAQRLWHDPERMRQLGRTAVDVYRRLYSEQAAYGALMAVYDAARIVRRAQSAPADTRVA